MSFIARTARTQTRVLSRRIVNSVRYESTGVTSKAETAVGTLGQAPNRAETWAKSQRPRSEAMVGPRFEQTDFSKQPQPYAAIELIAKEPIRYIHGSVAVCQGEKGTQQGHPKIYINVDKPGAHSCQYCGLRYAKEEYKADIEAGKLPSIEPF